MPERAFTSLRDLLEAAPDATVGVDRQGLLVEVNSEAARLFGSGRDDLEGIPVEVLIPEAVRGVHPRHRARPMANPQPRPMGAGKELSVAPAPSLRPILADPGQIEQVLVKLADNASSVEGVAEVLDQP